MIDDNTKSQLIDFFELKPEALDTPYAEFEPYKGYLKRVFSKDKRYGVGITVRNSLIGENHGTGT